MSKSQKEHTKIKQQLEDARQKLQDAQVRYEDAKAGVEQAKSDLVNAGAMAMAGADGDDQQERKAYKAAEQELKEAELHFEQSKKAVSIFEEKERSAFEKMQGDAEKSIRKKADQATTEIIQALDNFLVAHEKVQSIRDEARECRMHNLVHDRYEDVADKRTINRAAVDAYRLGILDDLQAEAFANFRDNEKWMKNQDQPGWQKKKWQDQYLKDVKKSLSEKEAKQRKINIEKAKQLWAEGCTTAMIAQELHLPAVTVKSYLAL